MEVFPHATGCSFSPTKRKGLRRPAGFTLVEMLVAMAIAAILLALAAPAMTTFLAQQAAASNADEFAAAIRFARAEAMKRGRDVTLCAAAAPDTAPACDGTTWQTGWAVTTAPAMVLKVQNGLRAMDGVNSSSLTIVFAATGIARSGLPNDPTAFTFVPVGGDTSQQRVVEVRRTGQVKVCVEDCEE